MSFRAVDAVEIICDGCGQALDDGEFQFFLREQADAWLDSSEWRGEDGKHYCCAHATPREVLSAGCWPPSMRDEDVE
jgi:hypothetical protein